MYNVGVWVCEGRYKRNVGVTFNIFVLTYFVIL